MVQILGHPLATQTTASFINPRLCWRERFSRYIATFSDLSPDLFLEVLLADVLPLMPPSTHISQHWADCRTKGFNPFRSDKEP